MNTTKSVFPGPLFACLAILFALGAVVMIQPIFEQLSLSLQRDVTDLRISFSLVSLTYAVAFFLIGPLTDRLNLRVLAMVFSGGLALSIALLSLMLQFVAFNLMIMVVGIMAAGTVATLFPYMTKIAPPEKRGKYLGYCLSASVTGIIVGRAFVGLFTDYFNWQLALQLYALVTLVIALGITFFLKIQSSLAEPMSWWQSYRISLQLLRNPQVCKSYISGFLLFISYLGTLTFLTYYLAEPPFSFGASEIGWISFPGLIAAFLAPMAGGYAQTYGYRILVLVGVITVLAALGVIYIATDFTLLLLGLLLLYSGVYICQPAVFYHITQVINPNQVGAASSLYLLACLSGGSFGSYLFGPIWLEWGWLGITITSSVMVLAALSFSIFTLTRAKSTAQGVN